MLIIWPFEISELCRPALNHAYPGFFSRSTKLRGLLEHVYAMQHCENSS